MDASPDSLHNTNTLKHNSLTKAFRNSTFQGSIFKNNDVTIYDNKIESFTCQGISDQVLVGNTGRCFPLIIWHSKMGVLNQWIPPYPLSKTRK